MPFEEAHARWLESHLSRRTGERRGRLERGHKHAEKLFLQKIWWELVRHFDNLHPEYEVIDWRGKSYYADFMLLLGSIKIIIEIKGFGPHVQEMDRNRYCEELNRELFMQALGYRVISFSFDDVKSRPELCITLLRLLLSQYQIGTQPVQAAHRLAREIYLLTFQLARPIRPKDIVKQLNINFRTAIRYLHLLCNHGALKAIPCRTGSKILQYERVNNHWEELKL